MKHRPVFILLVFLVLGINTVTLAYELFQVHQKKAETFFQFAGFMFLGLENDLRESQYAGYMTDRDVSEKENAARFAQAQYTLSPVILDLNNADHAYLLFDYQSETDAVAKIEKIGAVPLKKNKFGIILAGRSVPK